MVSVINGVYLRQYFFEDTNDDLHFHHRIVMHERDAHDSVVQIQFRFQVFHQGIRIKVAVADANLNEHIE